MSPNMGGWGGGGGGVSANEYSCTNGAQINSGDLTLYLTYGDREKDTYTREQKRRKFDKEITGSLERDKD